MKLKLFLFLGVLASFSACQLTQNLPLIGQKKEAQKPPQEVELSSSESAKFQENFYAGLRDKALGNTDRAISYFEKALSINEQEASIHFELSQLYAANNSNLKAQEFAQNAVDLNQENRWFLLNLSNIYEEGENFEKAAEIYEQYIALFDNISPEEYLNLGNFYLLSGQYEKAIDVLDRFEENFGDNPEIKVQKHKIYLNIDKVDKAAKELKKITKNYPKEVKYYRMLADLYMANERPKEAKEVFEKILELDKTDGKALIALADFEFRKENFPEGFQFLKKAIASDALEVDAKIKYLYSRFLVNPSIDITQKNEDLEAVLKTLVETHPEEAKANAIYGDFLYQRDENELARKYYRRSLEEEQGVFAVWQQLLFIEAELNDFEAMAEESDRALTYFPNQPLLYYFNAVGHIQSGNYKKGIESAESGLAMGGGNFEMKIQFYLQLAEGHHRLKNYQASDEAFEEAMKMKPDDPLILNNYAYYLSQRKENLEKAAEMSKKSLEKEPKNSAYLDTYGWIMFRKGDYQEARKYIQKALDQRPRDPELLEHFGDVLYHLSEKEAALSHWKMAVENGGDSETLKRKIEEQTYFEEGEE